MPSFGIFSPKLGTREDIPSILLAEAFLQADSRNVFEQDGIYKRLRGRLPTFKDADDEKIATPTDVFTITAINTTSKTITVTGDVLSGNTALASGDTIRINGGTTAANNALFTVNGTPSYSSPSSTIVVTESLSAAGATPGSVFVGATPIIAYHRHVKQKGAVEYVLVATAYHVFLWGNTAMSLTLKFTCGTPTSVERWDIVTHLDNVYATNGVDKVQLWDVQSAYTNSFETLGSSSGLDTDGGTTYVTQAKFMASYEGYLIVGYTTEGTGANNVYAQRFRWCSLRDPTDWQSTGGSGDAGYKECDNSAAFLNGFGKADNELVIFTNGDFPLIYTAWLTTADTVFEWGELTIKAGCLSADTIVNDKSGKLYFFASDLTLREIHTPDAISLPLDITIRGVNTPYAKYAQATYIEEYNHIWLAIPSASSETNNLILDYDIRTKTWVIHDIPVRAFGDYTRQTVYTYDDLPYDNYNDWGLDWKQFDTEVNVVGHPLDLVSDYSGYTYELHTAYTDDGDDFTGVLTIGTTLTVGGSSINQFKRVNNGIDLYFMREAAGDVTITVKRDNELSWQAVGTASLVDSNLPDIVIVHVPCDKRARFFQWKLTTADYFEFLGMAITDFQFDGTR